MYVRDRLFDEAVDKLNAVDAAEHVLMPVLGEMALEERLYVLAWKDRCRGRRR